MRMNKSDLHLRTTDEMLASPIFESEEKAGLLLRNTRVINDSIEDIKPVARWHIFTENRRGPMKLSQKCVR